MTPQVWVRSQQSAAYDDPGVATKAAELLDDGERRRWRGLSDPAAQRDYLAAHLLRRGMLAARAAIDAAAFRFRSGTGGQAQIVDPPGAAGFRSSLSHAAGMALCAVAYRLQVGASIRCRRSLADEYPLIAALVESRRAIRAIGSMPAPLREEWFLRLWTVREAIGRARGGAGPGEPAKGAPPDAVWQYVCWWLTPEHLAAVAVRRPGPRAGVVIRIEGEVLALVASA